MILAALTYWVAMQWPELNLPHLSIIDFTKTFISSQRKNISATAYNLLNMCDETAMEMFSHGIPFVKGVGAMEPLNYLQKLSTYIKKDWTLIQINYLFQSMTNEMTK